MNQGEFSNAKEYNATSEYKHFPAEIYIKPREENRSGAEVGELGREETTFQPKRRRKERSDDQKTLIDKLFNSIRGVATAATVAVTSVVVTTTFVAGAPTAELVSLSCGDTYVEYQMDISGIEGGGDYAIVVSTGIDEDIELAATNAKALTVLSIITSRLNIISVRKYPISIASKFKNISIYPSSISKMPRCRVCIGFS